MNRKKERIRISYEYAIEYETAAGKREMLKDLKDDPGYESFAYGSKGARRYKRIGKGRLEGDA